MFNLRNFFGFNKKVKSNKLEHLSTYSNLKSELEEINSSYEDLKLSGLIKGGAESFLNLKYEAKKEELEKRIEKAKNDLKKAVEEEVGNGGMEYLSYLGDSLGKKRSEMPQIPDEEEDRILMHFCRVGVPVTKEYPNIVDIKPSQYEFDQNIINKKIENADYKPVYFISQDNYLADGHHSWAGELEQGPHQVKVYRIGLPIRDLLRRLNLLKITFKNENNLNKSDIEIKKGIEDIVDLFEMNSGGGISNITLLNVEKIIEKRLKRDKGEIVYRYNPNELNLEKGEVETNIISPSESEKSVLTKAGGYPIGTIRHYKDGSSYKKVADTGGKGDWIKLEKVEKDPAPQLHLFHKDDVTKNPQTEQEQELVPTPTKKEFKPSKYQQAIFDFIENGEGNAVIDAVAGSGKTTTLVKALEKVPKRANTIFLAFNKSIVEELQKRTPSHVKVQTLHSLGISALFKLYGKAIKIDNYKISKLFTKAKEGWEDDEKSDGYKERVLKIVDLARYNVTKDKEALDSLCERYDIEITNKEVDRALELLGEADKDRKTFDFTDMLYVPVMENLKMDKYDYVFVDECQDLNKAQQLLFKKLLGEGSRFVACGDPYQSIYGFMGADVNSFHNLQNSPNTVRLPLSVSYRCPKKVVELAQTIVPHLEYHENAPEGEANLDSSISKIKAGDMVLCRNNAPIVKLCLQFIGAGKKAYVKGSDIGKNLITLVNKSKTDNLPELKDFLMKEYEGIKKKVAAKNPGLTEKEVAEHTASRSFAEKMIIINTIQNSSNQIRDVKGIVGRIEAIFKDNGEDAVIFSSIHKSKGLEAENVHILEPDLMPSKFAVKDWQKVQEENLRYVAYTRAKKSLNIINDWFFKNSDHNIEYTIKKLNEGKLEKSLYSDYLTAIHAIVNLDLPYEGVNYLPEDRIYSSFHDDSKGKTLTKGGAPIGTIKNYQDGSSWKKVADTGGKGDWEKINKEEAHKKREEPKKEKKESDPHREVEVSDEEIDEYESKIPSPTVEQRWGAYDSFLDMVAGGVTKSLVAFGTGGVGKTFSMKKVLAQHNLVEYDETKHNINNPDDYDYIKITGAGSGSSVYQALFEYSDKLIIFDDCDSVLKDQSAVNFFKGALDSTGDGTISYKSSQPLRTEKEEGAKLTASGLTVVPDRFKFTGSVIFISNLPPTEIPQPLIDSRCLSVDLSMTKDETIERLHMILPHMDVLDSKGKILEGITEEDKKDALNFLDEHKDNLRIGKLNARSLGNIIKIIHSSRISGKNWKDVAITLLYN